MNVQSAIYNSINLFSKLNSKRAGNIFSLLVSYLFSIITKRYLHKGLPYAVSIEPTNSCNLKCPECPTGRGQLKRPKGSIDAESFKKVINQLSDNAFYLNLYFQGEPYLSPELFDCIQYAKSKKMYVATSTNAHFLDDESAKKTITSGLDKIIVSYDGLDQNSYSSYRKQGNLLQVQKGIANLIKWKKVMRSKTPFIVSQFLVLSTNEHQVKQFKKQSKKMGVTKAEIKTAQLYDFENGHILMPTNTKYSRYKKNADGSFSINKKLQNKCFRMWSSAVVTWDGFVVPCCYDKDATNSMGSIKERPFIDIWKSEKYQNFRKTILNNRKQISICQNCTE